VSESDVRDGLRGAVADEPPLSFDPDALMTTAEHQAKRRRALVAVGVATVAVAVAAIALPVALGRDAPAQVAEQPSVSSSAPTPVAWPPRDVSPVSYTVPELRQRAEEMRGHLKTAFAEVLPAATAVEVGQFSGEAEGEILDGQRYLNAAVTFTVDGDRYSIMVAVFAPGEVTDPPSVLCAASGAYCRDLGTTDGGPVAAKTEDLEPGTVSTVYHFRQTGAQVYATAYNYDMTSRTPPVYHPTVPVTLDQLERLATDPAFWL